jgi:2-(1,2-epoxy-1,2-dihydrophenyl)acetyl-CoA isomerase
VSSQPSTTLLCEIEAGVATLTLNRPASLNALNLELKADLAAAIGRLRARADVRAVVLTGAGRGFCSGGDIKEMDPGRSAHDTRARLQSLHRDIIEPLGKLEKPVIAAVNGVAAGAGLSLALACDIVFASQSATFALAFAKRGLVPDAGAAFRLVRLVGVARAKELAFSARTLDAQEAGRLGLVQCVLPAVELLQQTQAYARELAGGATVALGLTKRLLDLASHSSYETMMEHEIGAAIQAIATSDHAEALRAFADKRAPHFQGR